MSLDDSVIRGQCSNCRMYREELREAREKLAAVEEHLGRLRERTKRGGSPKQHALWLAATELDRILKGGE